MPMKLSTKREAMDDHQDQDHDGIDSGATASSSALSTPAPSSPSPRKEPSASEKEGSPEKKPKVSIPRSPTKSKVGAWTAEEEKTCLLRALATADVKMTKELSLQLQAQTGRSADAIGNWWSKKVQTELKKLKGGK